MNLRIISLAFMTFLLIGCDLKKDDKIEDVSIENENLNEPKESENIQKYQTYKELDEWQGYYKKNVSDFDMSSFNKKESFDLVPQETNVTPIWDSKFNPVYKNFIRYNYDSTQYIDFMSYKLQFDENNEIIMAPDQEVVIVDIPNKKSKRILFYGPSYWIEDAYFKNDTTIVLLENSTDKVPAYQEINLNTLKSDYYTHKKPIDLSSEYLKEKVLRIYKKNY